MTGFSTEWHKLGYIDAALLELLAAQAWQRKSQEARAALVQHAAPQAPENLSLVLGRKRAQCLDNPLGASRSLGRDTLTITHCGAIITGIPIAYQRRSHHHHHHHRPQHHHHYLSLSLSLSYSLSLSIHIFFFLSYCSCQNTWRALSEHSHFFFLFYCSTQELANTWSALRDTCPRREISFSPLFSFLLSLVGIASQCLEFGDEECVLHPSRLRLDCSPCGCAREGLQQGGDRRPGNTVLQWLTWRARAATTRDWSDH
ncbi:uncharacterized protein LOC112340722 isoform X1 [Selaginella moellendorffii]|uniref:uncharacterized protein LOC112340722 isoform X1 n=1 Tax=Selaginella moellendorffii TaxID=88036 RepID=UPI000D1C23CB|nr:uncharacterized protein LOC112340722 isoform X1 [Selaginella moellendorffii]XP_024515384.1 uncharacterized protein LOC112340722 isoform X1 [Selaginella moellendorffii]|eukprot:XP_024515383.1 uncharacterized protein LOC112340722 isoform X1 [Selaginella moellendorffii]